ncbi:MAG: DNA-binding protein [Bacteroides sp.]|nr:DNA-binding protein [Bacteroides sp.]
MGIKVKARQTKLSVGPSAGKYRFIMQAEIYSTLKQEKVIAEAAMRSGISKGTINASWEAIGDVIRAWATEGHSVAIPGLGTMRFGVQAEAVEKVDDVSTELISTRKVIFTPSVAIKQELKNTSINITCCDKDGKVVKQVNSSDPGNVGGGEGGSDGDLDENPMG